MDASSAGLGGFPEATHGRRRCGIPAGARHQPELCCRPRPSWLSAGLRRAVGQRHIKLFGQGVVTGTVTEFWRELRGSGSFMDTDPSKIRGGVKRFLRSYGVARLREGSRKNGIGGAVKLFSRRYTRAREIYL